MNFKIEYSGYQVVENAPFAIDRPEGSYRYIFFHFISQVTIDIGGTTINAQPGSCILYQPKFAQKFYVEKNRLNHDYLDFLLIDDSFFESISFPLNTLIHPKLSSFITSTMKEINDEKNIPSIGSKYKIDALVTEMFIEITRSLTKKTIYKPDNYEEELKNKFDEIRLKMYQSPDNSSVKTIASSLGFSLSRFNTLYKSYFGITPINDLTNARISRVKDLINEDVPTKQIIKKIGFSSEEYFYRWFKKHFKTTKVDYIKENKDYASY